MKKFISLLTVFLIFNIVYAQQISINSEHTLNRPEWKFQSDQFSGFPDITPHSFYELINETRERSITETFFLDSTIYYLYNSVIDSVIDDKAVINFDELNNEYHVTFYDWDSENLTWKNTQKLIYQRRPDNNLNYWNYYSWEQDSNKWINSSKLEYFYDNNSFFISRTYHYWNKALSIWEKVSKIERINDENGYFLTQITYLADQNDDWVFERKNEREYDQAGNVTTSEHYTWNGGLWVEEQKYDYVYTTEDLLIESYLSSWIENSWRNWLKNTYSYNEDNSLVLVETFSWTDELWEIKAKLTIEYSGNLETETRFDWDDTDSIWIAQYKDETLRNDIGNTLMYAEYYKDSAWIGIQKITYHYNEHQNQVIRSYYDWDLDAFDWIIKERAFNYFSIITFLEDNNSLRIKIFPNPVPDKLYIENKTNKILHANLYSSGGQFIKRFNLGSQNYMCNLEYLSEGIYFLHVTDGENSTTRRIIKTNP